MAIYPSYGIQFPDGSSSLPNTVNETICSLMNNQLPPYWAHANTGNAHKRTLLHNFYSRFSHVW